MLFGHQNDANQPQPQATEQPDSGYIGPQDQPAQTVAPQAPAAPQATPTSANPLAADPATGVSLPAVTSDSHPADTQSEPSVLNQPSAPVVSSGSDTNAAALDAGEPFSSTPVPATPAEAQQAASIDTSELDTPGTESGTVLSQDPAPAAVAPVDSQPSSSSVFGDDAPAGYNTAPAAPAGSDDLLSLKQQAISQLSPLVNHLDQSPEEKFRTTMMLIQSTDNSSLLQEAYNAAQSIADDKVRAQALLDVVNEINYFTQQKG